MKASLRASYQHNTENGRLYLSGTSQRDSYYSLNASWNGSFTATRHEPLSMTIVVVLTRVL